MRAALVHCDRHLGCHFLRAGQVHKQGSLQGLRVPLLIVTVVSALRDSLQWLPKRSL